MEIGTIELPELAPVPLVAFDPAEELVWCASQAGFITSHLLPSAAPYSRFRTDARATPAAALFPYGFGVIALTHDAVRFFDKGGMQQADVRTDDILGACGGAMATAAGKDCLAISSVSPKTSEPALHVLDLTTSAVASSLTLEQPVGHLVRSEPRSAILAAAGADGTIRLFDLRSGAKPTSSHKLFNRGVVCDFDVRNHAVITW